MIIVVFENLISFLYSALYKIIAGIEPTIILAFSVFRDKAVPMYSNYRKKTEFSSISQSLCLYLMAIRIFHTKFILRRYDNFKSAKQ